MVNSMPTTLHSPLPKRMRRALVVAFLLMVVLPVRFEIGPLQMTGLRLFLAAAIIPLTLLTLRRPHARHDPAFWLLTGYVIWSSIALSQTSPAHMFQYSGAMGVEILGGYLLARTAIQCSDDLRHLLLWAAGLLVLLLPFALWEAHSGDPLIVQLLRAAPLVTSVDIVSIAPRLGFERVQASFAHPIHFGLFTSSFFALSILIPGLLVTSRTAIALIAIAATFLSLSSGPLLALSVQIALLAWAMTFGRTRMSWLTFFVLLIAIYVAIDLASNRSPLRVFMSYATFSAHNAFWRGLIFEWGMHNVLQNPVFGIGFNDWIRPHFMISGSIDNFWLANAMRFGVPGLLLLATAFCVILARGVRQCATSDTHLAWTITLAALGIALFTVHIWTSIHAFFFFFAGAVPWVATDRVPEAHAKPMPLTLPFSRNPAARYVREGVVPWA